MTLRVFGLILIALIVVAACGALWEWLAERHDRVAFPRTRHAGRESLRNHFSSPTWFVILQAP